MRGVTATGSAVASSFPFLFGGTFIEGPQNPPQSTETSGFPFLFGGTFIEGRRRVCGGEYVDDFPSFSEGLSLREMFELAAIATLPISLPFRRDFH